MGFLYEGVDHRILEGPGDIRLVGVEILRPPHCIQHRRLEAAEGERVVTIVLRQRVLPEHWAGEVKFLWISLARKLLFEVGKYTLDSYVNELKGKVGNELLKTHKSYWPAVKRLVDGECVSAMAHVTGGGITENLPRVLPRGTAAVIEFGSWPVLPIFEHLQQLGNVPQEEMLRTFNMGMGMLLVVPSKKFKKAQTVLERVGEKAFTVGRIVKGERKVMYT